MKKLEKISCLKLFKQALASFYIGLFICNSCLAQESIKGIKLYAHNADKGLVSTEIDSRITKKYNVVQLEVQNKTNNLVYLPSTAYFTTTNGEKHSIDQPQVVYKKVKKPNLRKATLIFAPMTILSFGMLIIPAMALSSVAYVCGGDDNKKIQATIQKSTYKALAIPDKNTYQVYFLIPKKYSNPEKSFLKI